VKALLKTCYRKQEANVQGANRLHFEAATILVGRHEGSRVFVWMQVCVLSCALRFRRWHGAGISDWFEARISVGLAGIKGTSLKYHRTPIPQSRLPRPRTHHRYPGPTHRRRCSRDWTSLGIGLDESTLERYSYCDYRYETK
jgi:hypothetical protein